VTSRFQRVLEERPAPRVLGDVALRYEPSMLIGETAKPLRSWKPTALWTLALVSGIAAVALLATGAPTPGVAVLVLLAAVLLLAAVWLERVERRRRAFVVNFLTNSLRLDFVTPFAGRPRTLVVPFDAVKSVDVFDQDAGFSCLTVDFVAPTGAPVVLREVLAAFIPEEQQEELERLTRVLGGAFGLGAPGEPAEPEPGPPERRRPDPHEIH